MKNRELSCAVALSALCVVGWAGSVHARPDVTVQCDKGAPNPDGTGNDYDVKYKVKRKGEDAIEVKVTLPGDGCSAAAKAEKIAAAMKNKLGQNAASSNNGSVTIKGDSSHSVENVERKRDTTGEKDKVKFGGTPAEPIDEYAFDFRLGVNPGMEVAIASGTNNWENGVITNGSWLTVGIEGLNVTTVDVVPGMTMPMLIAAAHGQLVNDPATPQQMLSAMSLQGGELAFSFAPGTWNTDWSFVIQTTDIGLGGAEFASVSASLVPAPGVMGLLGLGGLVAARRRRR